MFCSQLRCVTKRRMESNLCWKSSYTTSASNVVMIDVTVNEHSIEKVECWKTQQLPCHIMKWHVTEFYGTFSDNQVFCNIFISHLHSSRNKGKGSPILDIRLPQAVGTDLAVLFCDSTHQYGIPTPFPVTDNCYWLFIFLC